MKPLCGAILLAAVLAGRTAAASYDDFNQGLEAGSHGDSGAEIVAFTRALSSGDLAPSLQRIALFDRGEAYEQRKQFLDAIADFSAVLHEQSDYIEARQRRAQSHEAMANFAAALSDCEALTDFRPRSAFFLRWCGRLAFGAESYERASSYFTRAVQLGDADPRAAYDLLWLGLSGLRKGKTAASEMADAGQIADGDAWPSLIVKFFLGKTAENAVEAEALQGDAQTQRNRECEVAFYIGEWKLSYGSAAAAKPLFQRVVNLCPADYIELEPARRELKKLQ